MQIQKLPVEMNLEQMTELDKAFGLTTSTNSEIQCGWYLHVIDHSYSEGYASLETFLMQVGRRKFLMPIYTALAEADLTKERATAIYAQARPNYHSVSSNSIDELLDYKGDGHTSK